MPSNPRKYKKNLRTSGRKVLILCINVKNISISITIDPKCKYLNHFYFFHQIHQVNGPDLSGLQSLLGKEQTKHLGIKSCIIILKKEAYLLYSNHFIVPWNSFFFNWLYNVDILSNKFKSVLYNFIFELPLLQYDSYLQVIWVELWLKYQSYSSYWKIPLCRLVFFWHLKT